MFNNLFWYQSPDRHADDIVLVNGVSLIKGDMKRTEEFDKLMKVANQVLKHKTQWCGFVRGVFFMKGNLTIKDDLGRKMGFMFATSAKDYKKALYQALSTAGMEMDDDSQINLDSIKFRFVKKLAIAVAAATLIIIITFLAYGRE